MKKLFVTLMALTVLGVQAFAAPAGLNEKVSRKAQASRDTIETKKADVLANLKSFRAVTEKRTQFNGSYVMQDMLGLLDSYLALAKASESAALSLNAELNQPIKAGWGRTVTVAQLVRDNSHHVMAGTSTADDFDRFEEMLAKKAVTLSAEQQAVLKEFDSFRQNAAAQKESRFIVQSMTYLMDSYLALPEKDALALNKTLNEPFAVGWTTHKVTLASLIRDYGHHVMAGTSTADDFEYFADMLIK